MNLLESAEKALKLNMGASDNENVLIVFDETTEEIADALIKAAKLHNLEVTSEKIALTGGHGVEPPEPVCRLMLEHKLILAPTMYSLTHTDAVRNAVKNGARAATLPGINSEIFLQGLAADPYELHSKGEKWCRKLDDASKVNVKTSKGTDITFSVNKYKAENDDGLITKPGIFGNLPAGEAFIAPDETSASGIIVFDGTIGGQEGEDISSEVVLTLENGRIADFGFEKTTDRGRIRAGKLYDTLIPYGPDAFLLAEFGIGTNSTLKMSGNLLGDEKLDNTVHFAFGNNCSMGGSNNVKVHIDCLVLNPEIVFS
jgi:leucyl aminopeptidase (aminopeptidase T)